MESEWFNNTLTTNESSPVTGIGNDNSTISGELPNKTHTEYGISWATEKKAMYIIGIVLHCTFLSVGLFGNILTIVVMVYKKWSNMVSRHVLLALAVSDTTMIITQTFNQDFLQDLVGLDLRAVSNLGCKIFYLFYRTSKMTSSWFVVFICFERFIAVTFPLRAKSIITHQRTKLYILFNYLLMTCFNIGQSFSTAVENETCKKDVFASNEKATFRALILAEMLLFSVIPVVLMLILTPVIIFMLSKHHQKRKSLSSNAGNGNRQENRQLQELIRQTVILVSVVVTFIICLAPMTVFQQIKFWQSIKKQDIGRVFSTFMFKTISQWFEQINYSVNFFLYILSSSAFRASVLEILHIKNRIPLTSGGKTATTKGNKTTTSWRSMEQGNANVPVNNIHNALASKDDIDKDRAVDSNLLPTNNVIPPPSPVDLARQTTMDSNEVPSDNNRVSASIHAAANDKAAYNRVVAPAGTDIKIQAPSSNGSLAKDKTMDSNLVPPCNDGLAKGKAVDSNLVPADNDGLAKGKAVDSNLVPADNDGLAKGKAVDSNLVPACTDGLAKDEPVLYNLVLACAEIQANCGEIDISRNDTNCN